MNLANPTTLRFVALYLCLGFYVTLMSLNLLSTQTKRNVETEDTKNGWVQIDPLLLFCLYLYLYLYLYLSQTVVM